MNRPPEPLGQPELETSAQLLSQVANSVQQRQESTQREALRERPDFILDIEQSEVAYTLRPKFIPLAYIDYPAFAHALRAKWGLSLDSKSLKVDPMLTQQISEDSKANEEIFQSEVMRYVLQERHPSFGFTGGKYPVSGSEFVQILSVKLNHETVLVSVGGISKVAENIAQEILELVNAAAGAERPWSMLEDEVQIVGYATKTKVNLGSELAFESLLSPNLLSFIESDVTHGQQLGAHMGGYQARHGLGPAPNSRVVFALDDLTFHIASFDEATASYKESDVRFSVTARSDYRSGTVSISSEFPYHIHEKFVGGLIQDLSA